MLHRLEEHKQGLMLDLRPLERVMSISHLRLKQPVGPRAYVNHRGRVCNLHRWHLNIRKDAWRNIWHVGLTRKQKGDKASFLWQIELETRTTEDILHHSFRAPCPLKEGQELLCFLGILEKKIITLLDISENMTPPWHSCNLNRRNRLKQQFLGLFYWLDVFV